jgi:ATP-dependent Clp protease adaptor protein ClpS
MSPQATPDILEQTEVETELAQVWKVIVLNDPVNLMNYVVMVFRKVFGYGEQKAIKHMQEVHELGKSILWAGGARTSRKLCFSAAKVAPTGCFGKG